MSVTEYIATFAEYFVMLINMIKEFFAGLGGGNTGDDNAEDKGE